MNNMQDDLFTKSLFDPKIASQLPLIGMLEKKSNLYYNLLTIAY